MSFSRYDHSPPGFSRPSPEPEVRRAIMTKWAMFDQGRAREVRCADARNGGARP